MTPLRSFSDWFWSWRSVRAFTAGICLLGSPVFVHCYLPEVEGFLEHSLGMAVSPNYMGRTSLCRIDNIQALKGTGTIVGGRATSPDGQVAGHVVGISPDKQVVDLTAPGSKFDAVEYYIKIDGHEIIETNHRTHRGKMFVRYVRGAMLAQTLTGDTTLSKLVTS